MLDISKISRVFFFFSELDCFRFEVWRFDVFAFNINLDIFVVVIISFLLLNFFGVIDDVGCFFSGGL